MTERRSAFPADAVPPPWDAEAIRDAVDPSGEAQTVALPSPTANRDDGGLGLVLGDPPQAVLELYPSARRLLLRTPGVRLELDGIDPPTIGPEGVVFARTSSTHAVWLSLGPGGELTLQRTPVATVTAEGPTIAPAVGDDADRAIGGLAPKTPVAGHPGPQDVAADMPSPVTSEDGKDERQERVKLFGRLATPVRFKTQQNGRFIAEFVLAERLDEEETAFHKVTVFDNPRTKRLVASTLKALVDAGELGKGKPASVVGYRHTTERRKNDGTTKTEVQIYAVAVSAR